MDSTKFVLFSVSKLWGLLPFEICKHHVLGGRFNYLHFYILVNICSYA